MTVMPENNVPTTQPQTGRMRQPPSGAQPTFLKRGMRHNA